MSHFISFFFFLFFFLPFVETVVSCEPFPGPISGVGTLLCPFCTYLQAIAAGSDCESDDRRRMARSPSCNVC